MSFESRRRHFRARLPQPPLEPAVEFCWPNHESSAVLDLSFKGLAVEHPGLFKFADGDELDGELKLAWIAPFALTAKIVWQNADRVGLVFFQLSAEGHQGLRQFLDPLLAAERLAPVASQFIAPHQTFQRWYQCESNAHVFLWKDSQGSIQQARVESPQTGVVEFYAGKGLALARPQLQRAFLILHQLSSCAEPDLVSFLNGLRGEKRR